MRYEKGMPTAPNTTTETTTGVRLMKIVYVATGIIAGVGVIVASALWVKNLFSS